LFYADFHPKAQSFIQTFSYVSKAMSQSSPSPVFVKIDIGQEANKELHKNYAVAGLPGAGFIKAHLDRFE
jgi:hypothetical protein